MMKLILHSFLIFTATVASRDFSYQEYHGGGVDEYKSYETVDYGYSDVSLIPKFLSTPQTFSVEVTDDITFPCDAEKLGSELPMMFKHISKLSGRERTIYLDNTLVNQNSRIRKEGSSFVLEGVRKTDAGQYICIFETEPHAIELRHNLVVKYPAKVERVSPDFQSVKQGSSVTLQCTADGNPPPAITWSKGSGSLPSGLQTEEGDVITFENVDRHVEGDYICTASNGIGETSSANIKIEVEYMPEIKSQQEMVNTPAGYEAVLTCLVHGRPKPAVIWYRDDNLVSSHRHTMTHDGSHRHTLTINHLEETDFGAYSCVAKNMHGEVAKQLYLTGFPRSPDIISNPNGGEPTSYTLQWKTETLTPINVYRIRHREINDIRHTKMRPVWNDQLYSAEEKKSVRDTHFNHKVKMVHMFEGLRASNDYEVIVMVENKFGWSKESKVFRFNTRKEWKISQLASEGRNNILSSLTSFFCLLIVFL